MRVALLTANAMAGDAIGDQVAEKTALFRDQGDEVRVFLASDRRVHPIVRPCARVGTERPPAGEDRAYLADADLIIAEFGQFYPLLHWLPVLAGGRARLLVDYHGITPRNSGIRTTPNRSKKGSSTAGSCGARTRC